MTLLLLYLNKKINFQLNRTSKFMKALLWKFQAQSLKGKGKSVRQYTVSQTIYIYKHKKVSQSDNCFLESTGYVLQLT